MDSLIGYSGFVGSNLLNNNASFNLYNSKNIHELSSVNHNTIFCAAPNAEKWKINLNAENEKTDLNNIQTIINNLKITKFKKIVLFSSIDVYDNLVALDENHEIETTNHAYGKNRLFFENEVKKFPNWIIIRLPGLFGNGLKKNIIYDLLHDNVNYKINLNDKYQWYSLDWLHKDIKKIKKQKNKIFNFFTEPISNEELISNFFPEYNKSNCDKFLPYKNYNLNTIYSKTKYIKSKKETLQSLSIFINKIKIEKNY